MRQSRSAFDFDVAVIGGGSAGYAAARMNAAGGLKTVILEGGRELGGLCILRGCMPTKALLYAAEVRHLAQHGATWGLRPGRIGFDWRRVMARKDALIANFAGFRRRQLTRGQFRLLRATARFVDPHTVELNSGRRLRARHFVIATGSVVAPPPLPSLAGAGYLTSDDALRLQRPPKSLIVLGGGAVAVEFAQFFARFDTRVTVIQRSAQLLREFDADTAATLHAAFQREGIAVFTGTELLGARRVPRGKEVSFRHQGRLRRVVAEEILFALGRVPNTAGLGLERAGVQVDGGRILTDAQMRTRAPHIFAAGDCTSLQEIVHLAVQQGETAAHNILHPNRPRRMDDRLLLNVVFTDPQIATVGLTEKEATARGIPFRTASYPFNDHGKSMIMDVREGFVKLLCDRDTGEILGGTCAGPAGGELIHEIAAAMAKRMTVRELAALPHYHPTLAEIWTYPAEELAEQIRPARPPRRSR
jgi:pyruvate/2-oxoglutarate dehydrogenase complex dihydrolipoamide dehydrogenase (E3) component